MAGICQHCGNVVEKLHTCELCGAHVGSECKKQYGCKECGGMRTID